MYNPFRGLAKKVNKSSASDCICYQLSPVDTDNKNSPDLAKDKEKKKKWKKKKLYP
jgi:hypothetical protein